MNNTARIAALAALIITLCVSGTISAQVPGDPAGFSPPARPEWGTADRIAYVVPGYTFNGYQDTQYARTFEGYIYRDSGIGYWDQTIHLPSGALIDGVTTFYDDSDGGADVNFNFYHLSGTPTTGLVSTELLADSSSGSSGFQGQYESLSGGPHTVRNYDPDTLKTSFYLMVLNLSPSGTASDLAFGGAVVWYRLQISPAPGTATFSDVPIGHPFFQHIEALVSSGITSGCGGGNYCPNNPVTRGQMAVFLAKGLGLHWSDNFLP